MCCIAKDMWPLLKLNSVLSEESGGLTEGHARCKINVGGRTKEILQANRSLEMK